MGNLSFSLPPSFFPFLSWLGVSLNTTVVKFILPSSHLVLCSHPCETFKRINFGNKAQLGTSSLRVLIFCDMSVCQQDKLPSQAWWTGEANPDHFCFKFKNRLLALVEDGVSGQLSSLLIT